MGTCSAVAGLAIKPVAATARMAAISLTFMVVPPHIRRNLRRTEQAAAYHPRLLSAFKRAPSPMHPARSERRHDLGGTRATARRRRRSRGCGALPRPPSLVPGDPESSGLATSCGGGLLEVEEEDLAVA